MQQLHTPEEMRALSNLGHWIEGGILGIVAVIALLQALGYFESGIAAYLWPGLILLAGLFLPPYMLLHHGFNKVDISWRFVMGDPQQRQHFLMAVLLLVAGIAEVIHRIQMLQGQLWQFVWPSVLIVIGVLFTIHTQHGTHEAVSRAVTAHRYLGILLILGGLLKAAEVLWIQHFEWLAFPWTIMVLASAVLLISYREPEGAYQGTTHHSH